MGLFVADDLLDDIFDFEIFLISFKKMRHTNGIVMLVNDAFGYFLTIEMPSDKTSGIGSLRIHI